ncbi:MAG: STAS domain-containing protein [Candidatus Sulfotelmatobacter sp.]
MDAQDVRLRPKLNGCQIGTFPTKNYIVFMVPKPISVRLSISMQSPKTNLQPGFWPLRQPALVPPHKESQLKLSLETRNRGDIMIVHCQGRIVYRDEAAALSQLVGDILQSGGKIVLDLSGVHSIDSAGIGELVYLHTQAQSRNADLKCASPSPLVRELLDLTNLDSVLEIHPSLGEALAAFQSAEVCADC